MVDYIESIKVLKKRYHDYSFVIPTNPTTKKNSQRIIINRKTNKPQVIQSEKYREYEQFCLKHFAYRVSKKSKPDKPIEGRINLMCHFYRQTKHIVDLAGLLQAIQDILTHKSIGILADDNSRIVVSVDGSRVFYDKENPRTEIYIDILEE